jgi:molybdopterin molybdotransferase
MLSVDEAVRIVLAHAKPLPPETWPLSSVVLGQVLAENIVSDVDLPPHTKSMMDGFAVRSADLAAGPATLEVIDEVMAGHVPRQPVGPGQATRLMTGAPVPEGADVVIKVEDTRMVDERHVLMEEKAPKPGAHIVPKGGDVRAGEVVVAAGTVLRPAVIGLLAAVGRTAAQVYPAPRVGVLPTGDELVPAAQQPGPGQIRNSNGPMLMCQVSRSGGHPWHLGIARDEIERLRVMIREGLQAPVLVLSGGVSAGKADLVPGVLQELGVVAHFHKVFMKPGKPIFFGTAGSTLVFGLPGNPVSSLACFELFVRPALRQMRGETEVGPRFQQVPLADNYRSVTDRPIYHPAKIEVDATGPKVRPLRWSGSGDLRAVAFANALAQFPVGEHDYAAGQTVPVLRFEADGS